MSELTLDDFIDKACTRFPNASILEQTTAANQLYAAYIDGQVKLRSIQAPSFSGGAPSVTGTFMHLLLDSCMLRSFDRSIAHIILIIVETM